MCNQICSIQNDVQDRSSEAWDRLCTYVEAVAADGRNEFSPSKELGTDLFAQIHTLPETISKLRKVKKVYLYGSKLERIPPEIGEMKSLKNIDLYMSPNLHWFPYEIVNCRKLRDSCVSTRTLYGNFKNRMIFPSLIGNPIRYWGENLKCSVCKTPIEYDATNQLWITLRIGTDNLPLLANLCSKECEKKLPKPPDGYIQHPHKGGVELQQPSPGLPHMKRQTLPQTLSSNPAASKRMPKPLRVIWKIWERKD